MPIMDGLEALHHIRKLQNENKMAQFPIIFVSAGYFLSAKEILQKRIDKCLMKPISKVCLKKALEEIWNVRLCE